MFYKVKEVQALPDLKLRVRFIGGAVKIYDVAPLLKKWEPFRALKEVKGLFEQVHVDAGGFGVAWNEDIDLSCNELWANGVAENPQEEAATELLCQLIEARQKKGLSQRDVEARTGIKQPVIARVESGTGDPQLSTLVKMAEACGMKVTLEKKR